MNPSKDLTVDLILLYHNAKSNIVNSKDLDSLISEYYNIDSFIFDNNNETYINNFIDKFNIEHDDLVIFDKLKLNNYLENPNQFLNYNKGIILFNLSLSSDQELIDNINYLLVNYDNLVLNKFYDNYILYFSDQNKNHIDKNENKTKLFNKNLENIFIEDIQELLLWQKIQNIPHIIKNNDFYNKLQDDLKYNIIKKNPLTNNDLKTYEDSLNYDLNSANYQVMYNFSNIDIKDKMIEQNNIPQILNKFSDFNSYFNDILNDDKISSHNKISKLDKTDNLIHSITLNELFNVNNINNLYYLLQQKKNLDNNIIFKMSDISDNKIDIYNEKSNHSTDSEQFNSHIIYFINELMKAKIKKTIKLYNLTLS